MYICMHGCMDAYMHVCMYAWMYACMPTPTASDGSPIDLTNLVGTPLRLDASSIEISLLITSHACIIARRSSEPFRWRVTSSLAESAAAAIISSWLIRFTLAALGGAAAPTLVAAPCSLASPPPSLTSSSSDSARCESTRAATCGCEGGGGGEGLQRGVRGVR